MIVHSEPLFVIIFGDKRSGFIPRNYHALANSQEILKEAPFMQCKKWGIDSLGILHQTHSTQGLHIDTYEQAEQLKPFKHEADFSLTQLIGVGLAVVSADCLPLILYDKKNHAIANVHAGWRGSVDGIASIAFERMKSIFGSEAENMRIFLGPSAKRCCYSVGADVQDKVGNFSFKDEVLQQMGDLVMFDLPLFNKLQLESMGIAKDAFNDAYNICTIHTDSFNSYRRTQSPERQSTIVALR